MPQLPRYCLLVLVLTACSGDSTEPTPGNLTGVVSSTARGALAGVSVVLDDGGKTTSTDSVGRYSFADVTPGEHRVAVGELQAGCTAPAAVSIVQPENGDFAHDIAVECTPFGAVRGTLTGTHWGALPNVTIKGNNGTLHAVTDASGAFLLGGIVSASVTMLVDGAPADCSSRPLVKSVPPGDTIAVEWAMICKGPELRFLRQIRQGWPNADSGAIIGMHPYFSDHLSQEIRSLVVPYVGGGWSSGHLPAWRFELAPDRSAVLVSNDVDLYRIPMDGGAQLLYDAATYQNDHYGASYAPSGNEFIHSAKYNQGSYSIMTNAASGDTVHLNWRHRVFYSTAFAWHPDGMRILFQTDDYAGYDYPEDPVPGFMDAHIWIMNRDGSGRIQLTAGTWHDIRPTWSPDGTQVGFLSDRGGSGFEPYVMELDGSNQRPLPGNTYWIWASGELSPIGDVLVYAAETNFNADPDFDLYPEYGESSIYLAKPDGSEPRLLNTGGTGTDYSPYWVR